MPEIKILILSISETSSKILKVFLNLNKIGIQKEILVLPLK
jgi:hypothetical protein